jgi:4'-phosphopantetheinyl transferase
MKLFDIFQNRVERINNSYINCLLFTLYISDLSYDDYKVLSVFLNNEEYYKCKKFRKLEHSKKFIISRVFLKFALASILQKDISSIHFSYGPNGKPYLSDGSVFFNISHSKDLCLIGISFTNEIGVDIEFIDETIDYLSLLSFLASQEEIAWVLEKNSIKRFYKIWTLKESILKYSGQGISDAGFPDLFVNKKTLLYPNTITHSFIKAEKYAISLCTGLCRTT